MKHWGLRFCGGLSNEEHDDELVAASITSLFEAILISIKFLDIHNLAVLFGIDIAHVISV